MTAQVETVPDLIDPEERDRIERAIRQFAADSEMLALEPLRCLERRRPERAVAPSFDHDCTPPLASWHAREAAE